MFIQRDVFVARLMLQGYVVICHCHTATSSSEIILTPTLNARSSLCEASRGRNN